MPYIVNFTDKDNKTPVTVFDNTSNADTSINFPGRNVTGYGQIIAENFLHLLENFSSADAPANPVEGQLWFDSNPENKILMIWDNTQWKAASNIQRSTSEPSIETSKVGELWVDTTNQQLYVFSGASWILVGPNFSTGLRSGPVVESIIDSGNNDRVILTFYVDDVPLIIISKDSFTPKNSISGFTSIKSGINITTDDVNPTGGFLPKFYGKADSADSLNVGGIRVEAGKFLRSDTTNTTEQAFNVRNNAGITLGVDGTFSLTTTTTSAKIYNVTSGSSIDLQTNRNGVAETVLKVINDKVGINKATPEESLDISGNIKTDGSLILTNVAESTNFSNGSFRTAGGIAVTKNVLVGQNIEIYGQTITAAHEPRANDQYDLGTSTKRWNALRAKTVIADNIITGAFEGNVIGNATTATNLRQKTVFRMEGEVTSTANIEFDGATGGTTKTFTTRITSGLIKLKPEAVLSRSNDYVLTFRPGEDVLYKQTRDNFVADLGVPVGAIMPFAGTTAPTGYLLCDGSEVEIAKYIELYNIVGNTYGTPVRGATGLTFVLPDLRGRFPLGKHNMDNGSSVPVAGGFVDGGGGLPSSETVAAGGFIINRQYVISILGSTNWNAIGVPSEITPYVGLTFTATGAGTGSGVATVPIRTDDLQAQLLGGTGGGYNNTLRVDNLPQHEHDMKAINESGVKGANQFFATRLDTGTPSTLETGEGAYLGRGPITPGQMQFLPTSGGIKDYTSAQLGQSFSIINPFLTLNFIIRSGPPTF